MKQAFVDSGAGFKLVASPVPHFLQRLSFAACKHLLAMYRYLIVLTCLCGIPLRCGKGA